VKGIEHRLRKLEGLAGRGELAPVIYRTVLGGTTEAADAEAQAARGEVVVYRSTWSAEKPTTAREGQGQGKP